METVTIRLPAETKQRLRREAFETDRAMQDIVNEALLAHLRAS